MELNRNIVDINPDRERKEIQSKLERKILNYIRANFSNDAKDSMRIPLHTITHPPPKIKFDDVIGIDEGKQEVRDLLELLDDYNAIKKYKLKLPSSILLYGPPGCGKTHFAKAVAGEWGVPFIYVSPADITSRWAGETEDNIRHLFKFAKYISPCVLFLDELDGIGGARDGIMWRSERMDLSQLLTEIERVNRCYPPVIVIGATNRLEDVDFALKRPGRFSKKIFVGFPSMEERIKLFMLFTKNRPISSDVDFHHLSYITDGKSGADIENICDSAARNAWRRWKYNGGDGTIKHKDFIDVLDIKKNKEEIPIYR